MQDTSIKVSLEAYQELVLRKISTGVPIKTQIDRILEISHDTAKKSRKRSK